jgi:MFS family permease
MAAEPLRKKASKMPFVPRLTHLPRRARHKSFARSEQSNPAVRIFPLCYNQKVGNAFVNIFRALKHKNYRLFFAGQSISLVGTWIQTIALSWLVYRLTNSAFLLGFVAFASQLPALLFMSVAGVFVDRWDKHRILVTTQILAMLQAFAIAFLVFTNIVDVWHIMLLSMFLGFINAFDMPARQAFVVEMVEKEHLSNAIALNSTMVNAARLIGPAIAGVMIAAMGEGMCFLVNAVSYLAVIFSLLSMDKIKKRIREKGAPVFKELREGLAYVYRLTPVRDILFMLSLVSIAAMPYMVLMPIFARDILRGDSQTLGFLMAASGIGALSAGFFLASRRSVLGLGRIMCAGAFLFGVGLIVFALSRVFWLSMLLIFVAGFGMLSQIAASNTLVQTMVADDKRGRVMSLYSLAFLGTAPIGSLVAGSLAARVGAPLTLLLCGSVCVLASFLFFMRLPHLRKIVQPIYVELGILNASEITSPPEEM